MILGSVNFCMHGGIVGIVSWFRAGGLWVYFGHILDSSAHASGILSEEVFFSFFLLIHLTCLKSEVLLKFMILASICCSCFLAHTPT